MMAGAIDHFGVDRARCCWLLVNLLVSCRAERAAASFVSVRVSLRGSTREVDVHSSHFRRLMRPIRVLVAKPGLDGHDRGAKVVAAALRDAGMEVIYTGLHQTPEMIANAAIQEDVDVVGLSILSGAHMTLFPRVRELLADQGRDDVLITGGGIIPKEDIEALQRTGIGRLFGPGTPTSELIDYIRGWFAERQKQEA
jgi:methylmalonyl-CoA mutase C-terminal domain/subunit